MRLRLYLLVLLLISFACKEKKELLHVPFENRLIADDCVGSADLDALENQIAHSFVLEAFPMLSMFNFKSIRRKYGLESSKIYFSGNLEHKSGRAFLSVTDPKLLDENLEKLENQYNLITDSVATYKTYTNDDLKLSFVRIDSALLFSYNGDINTEIDRFNKHIHLDTAWNVVFRKANQPVFVHYASEKLRGYSISDLNSIINLDSAVHFSVLVNKEEDFPFVLNQPQNTLKDNESNLSIDLTLKNQNINKHQLWSNLVNDLGSKISFPAKLFFDTWLGDIHFSKGGKTYDRVEEIVTVLDENFNTVEHSVFYDKEVEANQFTLSLNSYADSLFLKMEDKGFLQRNDKYYKFFILTTLNHYKTQSKHTFYAGRTLPKLKSKENIPILFYKDQTGSYYLNLVKDSENQTLLRFTIVPNTAFRMGT